jgi:hypothetical protein
LDYLIYLFIFIAGSAIKLGLGGHEPLVAGALAAVCAWAVEPYAARKFLFLAVLVALFPAADQLALVCLAAAAGLLPRCARGDNAVSFLAGLLGALAICLSPGCWPLVVAGYGALLLGWLTGRPAVLLVSAGAGVFDLLGMILAFHPPHGGYPVLATGQNSLLFLALGFAMLAGGALCWRLTDRPHVRPLGSLVVGALLLGWVVWWFRVGGRLPVPGLAWVALPPAVYAAWRGFSAKRGRLLWVYLAVCLVLAGLAGWGPVGAVGLAMLAPLAVSEAALRLQKPAPKAPWAV